MPKMVFFKSFTKFGWVCGALLEFKSRPKFDESIFESYVHLNLVVLELDGKIFVGKGGNKNEARNAAALKCLHESGFEI